MTISPAPGGRLRGRPSAAARILLAAALAVGLSPVVVTASAAAPGVGGYDPTVVEPVPAAVATPSPEPVTVTYPDGETITVERTADLRRSVIRVSWTGFRPTNTPVFSERTLGPITVMQCHTADPRREFCATPGRRAVASGELPDSEPNPAYRADPSAGAPDIPFVQFGPDGTVYPRYTDRPDNTLPENTRSGTTIAGPDGTTSGQVDIEIRTKRESPSLGCDETALCSIVVVPLDRPIDPTTTVVGLPANALSVSNWARRAVFPLTFAPDNSICPLGEAETDTFGSELLSDAITQWQPALCQDPIDVTLGFAYQGEDESRRQFGQIVTDTDPANDGRAFAFVSRPVPDLPPTRPVAYAPVAVSAVAVSFLLDDNDGRPIETVKLSPRLLAKLLTQSYDYREFGNPSVADNPPGLYQDEEFLALNPTLSLPFSRERPQPIQVRADGNDLVWELWRWIGQDADARAWLDGTPDPYGMTVHPLFRGLALPASSVEKRDDWVVPATSPNGEPSITYGGQQFYDLLYQYPESYATVTANLVIGRSPAALDRISDELGVRYRPISPAAPGQRGLIAITDLASATRSRFRLAELPNSTGAYVAPSNAAMEAALATTTEVPGSDLLAVDHGATTAAAYPLTMVSYAVAPTTGVDPEVAAKWETFLRFAGGPGQTPGTASGTLPPGYLPLPADLRADTLAAAEVIGAQSGTVPGPSATPTTPSTVPPGGGSTVPPGDAGTIPPLPPGPDAGGPVPPAPAPTTTPAPGGAPGGGAVPSASPSVGTSVVAERGRTPGVAGSTPLRVAIIVMIVLSALGAVGGPLLYFYGQPGRALSGRSRRQGLIG